MNKETAKPLIAIELDKECIKTELSDIHYNVWTEVINGTILAYGFCNSSNKGWRTFATIIKEEKVVDFMASDRYEPTKMAFFESFYGEVGF